MSRFFLYYHIDTKVIRKAAMTEGIVLSDIYTRRLMIVALGGAHAVVEIVQVIQDVGQWFP